MTYLSVIYAIKEHWLTWVWAILSALFYAYIYYMSGLVVSAEIQILYLAISVLGLLRWQKHPVSQEVKERIKKGSLKLHAASGLAIMILGFGLFYLNFRVNQSLIVFYDSLLVACAIVAQFLMAKKYISCWYLWVFVNVGYLPLFYVQKLYVSLILYIILFYFTILGMSEWHRKLKPNGYDPNLSGY